MRRLEDTEHDECRACAVALEGIAGTIHAGLPLAQADVRQAIAAASQVFAAGPQPDPAAADDFQEACTIYERAIEGACAGFIRDAVDIERNARRVAAHLRRMAERIAQDPLRGEPPGDLKRPIAALARRYARYGLHQAA